MPSARTASWLRARQASGVQPSRAVASVPAASPVSRHASRCSGKSASIRNAAAIPPAWSGADSGYAATSGVNRSGMRGPWMRSGAVASEPRRRSSRGGRITEVRNPSPASRWRAATPYSQASSRRAGTEARSPTTSQRMPSVPIAKAMRNDREPERGPGADGGGLDTLCALCHSAAARVNAAARGGRTEPRSPPGARVL